MTTIKDYNPIGVGVPWVRKEDYDAFLSVMDDADNLPDTWEKFVEYTTMFENKWKADGYIVERAYIDPELFPDWCRKNGQRPDTQGRKHFAASVVKEKYAGERH